MSVSWIDEDHLFVGTDFGMNSMTDSGYPRIQKIWQRGTDLADAKTVLEVGQKSVAAYAYRASSKDNDIDILIDSRTFWTNDFSQYINGKKVHLNLGIAY